MVCSHCRDGSCTFRDKVGAFPDTGEEVRPVLQQAPCVRHGFYKADCSQNIFKPAQSRMPKRWVADDKHKGQCWAAKSTDGWSTRDKQRLEPSSDSTERIKEKATNYRDW